jgi:hypothetical protein
MQRKKTGPYRNVRAHPETEDDLLCQGGNLIDLRHPPNTLQNPSKVIA